MNYPKNMNGGAWAASVALFGAFLLPIEFVVSAMIFALVIRGGLHLLELAGSQNAKPEELDET